MPETFRPGDPAFRVDQQRQLVLPSYLVGDSNFLSPEVVTVPERESSPFKRVIIASNRSPMKTITHPDGSTTRERSIGGLSNALLEWGIKSDAEVLWIAWNGGDDGDEVEQGGLEVAYSAVHEGNGVHMVEFPLSKRQKREYYEVISNERFWFLFHRLDAEYKQGVGPRDDFDMPAWHTYKQVNRKFAREMMKQSNDSKEDLIWIHDYHLMTAASEMRKLGSEQTIAFFLHIPFPPNDRVAKLPKDVREDLVEGLLANDVIGFQTPRDRDNFLQTAVHVIKEKYPDKEMQITSTDEGEMITIDGRKVLVQAFPISIDADGLEREAATDEVQTYSQAFATEWGEGRETMLHLSRLDPSKGILETLTSYRNALQYYEELRGFLHLALAVDPGSRLGIKAYRDLQEAQMELVAEINKEFPGAITHYKGLDRPRALAALKEQKLLSAQSDWDGMNLTVLEAGVLGPEDDGVIVGYGVGASQRLEGMAYLVDPKDTETNAHVIYQAVKAPHAEKVRKKQEMYHHVKTHDVDDWGNQIVGASTMMFYLKEAA